jgi:nickel transport protein
VITAAIVLICLLSAVPASAHGAGYELLDGGMVGVRATFDTGQPVANAEVLIFAPGETRAEMTASTDPRGVICFAPDRAGLWVLQIRAEGGHGLRINLEIDESMLASAPSSGAGSFTTWQKLVMALCVLWGFAATALLFRHRRREG